MEHLASQTHTKIKEDRSKGGGQELFKKKKAEEKNPTTTKEQISSGKGCIKVSVITAKSFFKSF